MMEQERLWRLVEAALDPKGKWYGGQRSAAPLMTVDQLPPGAEDDVVIEREPDRDQEPRRWDEWEPA